MNWQDALVSLIPVVGDRVVGEVAEELQKLSDEADDPVKKLALTLMIEAAEEKGADGIQLAEKAIKDLLNGEAPQIDWARPRTASDAVALLQNAEADRQNAARETMERAGHVLAKVGAALLKAAIAAA